MSDSVQTREARRRSWAGALALLFLLLLFGGAITLVRQATAHPQAPGMAATAPRDAAPLDLATVSDDVAAQYRFAAAHEEHYAAIPCYCGCDKFLDHRNLHDCFVRADGRGWDAHGAGCAICLGEARQASRMLQAGRDPTVVRDSIIETFGPQDT